MSSWWFLFVYCSLEINTKSRKRHYLQSWKWSWTYKITKTTQASTTLKSILLLQINVLWFVTFLAQREATSCRGSQISCTSETLGAQKWWGSKIHFKFSKTFLPPKIKDLKSWKEINCVAIHDHKTDHFDKNI